MGILVHELPDKSPFEIAEISEMLDAADIFISVADEGFARLLYGLYPTSQQAMNQTALEECKAIEEELDRFVDVVAERFDSSGTVRKVQKAWRKFAESEAQRNAKMYNYTDGPAYSLFYHVALKGLASDRLRQLQSWVENPPGEE